MQAWIKDIEGDQAVTESMVERMARAAFNAHSQRGEDHWANADPIQRETKIREMTAALMAMREPTDLMSDAGDETFDWTSSDVNGSWHPTVADADKCWSAMIDAALKWPAGSADRAGVPMARD